MRFWKFCLCLSFACLFYGQVSASDKPVTHVVNKNSLFYDHGEDKINLQEVDYFLQRLAGPKDAFGKWEAQTDSWEYTIEERRAVSGKKDPRSGFNENTVAKFRCNNEALVMERDKNGASDSLVVFEYADCIAKKLQILANDPGSYVSSVKMSEANKDEYLIDPESFLRQERNKLINDLDSINNMVFSYKERTTFEALSNITYNAWGPAHFIPRYKKNGKSRRGRSEAYNLLLPGSDRHYSQKDLENIVKESGDVAHIDPSASDIWSEPDWDSFNAKTGAFSKVEKKSVKQLFPKSKDKITVEIMGKTLSLDVYSLRLKKVKMTAHRSPKYLASFKNSNGDKQVVKVKFGEEVSPAITADRLAKFAGYSKSREYIKHAPVIRFVLAKKPDLIVKDNYLIEKSLFEDSGDIVWARDFEGHKIQYIAADGTVVKGKETSYCNRSDLDTGKASIEAIQSQYFGEFWHDLDRYLVPDSKLQEKEFHENCALLLMDGAMVGRPGQVKNKSGEARGRVQLRLSNEHLDRHLLGEKREERGFLFTLALLNIGNVKPINRRTLIELMEDDNGVSSGTRFRKGQSDIGDSFGIRDFVFNSGVLNGYKKNKNLCQSRMFGTKLNWRDYGEAFMMKDFYRNVTESDIKWNIALYAPLLTKEYRPTLDKIFKAGAWSDYERDAFQLVFAQRLYDCVQAFDIDEDLKRNDKNPRYENISLDKKYIEEELIEGLEVSSKLGLDLRKKELGKWADQEPGRVKSIKGNQGSLGNQMGQKYLTLIYNKLSLVELLTSYYNWNQNGGNLTVGVGPLSSITTLNSAQHRPDSANSRYTKIEIGGFTYPSFRFLNLISSVWDEKQDRDWKKNLRLPGLRLEYSSPQGTGIKAQVGAVKTKTCIITRRSPRAVNQIPPLLPLKHLWISRCGMSWKALTGFSKKNLWKFLANKIPDGGDIAIFVELDEDAVMTDNTLLNPIMDLFPNTIAQGMDFFQITLGLAPYISDEIKSISIKNTGDNNFRVIRVSESGVRTFSKVFVKLGARLGNQMLAGNVTSLDENFTYDFSDMNRFSTKDLQGKDLQVAEFMSDSLWEILNRKNYDLKKTFEISYEEDTVKVYKVDKQIAYDGDDKVKNEVKNRVLRHATEYVDHNNTQVENDFIFTTYNRYNFSKQTKVKINTAGEYATSNLESQQDFEFITALRRRSKSKYYSYGNFEYLFSQGLSEAKIRNVYSCIALDKESGFTKIDFDESRIDVLFMEQIAQAEKEEIDKMIGFTNQIVGEKDYMQWYSPVDFDDGEDVDSDKARSARMREFKTPVTKLLNKLSKLSKGGFEGNAPSRRAKKLAKKLAENAITKYERRLFGKNFSRKNKSSEGFIDHESMYKAFRDYLALYPELRAEFDGKKAFGESGMELAEYKRKKSLIKRVADIANGSRVHYQALVSLSGRDDSWTPVDKFNFVTSRLDLKFKLSSVEKIFDYLLANSDEQIVANYLVYMSDKMPENYFSKRGVRRLVKHFKKKAKEARRLRFELEDPSVSLTNDERVKVINDYTNHVTALFNKLASKKYGFSVVRSVLGEDNGHWIKGSLWGPAGQVTGLGHSYQTMIGSVKTSSGNSKDYNFLNYHEIGMPLTNCMEKFTLEYNPEDPDQFNLNSSNTETSRAVLGANAKIAKAPHGQIFNRDLMPYFYIPGGAIQKIK